MSRKAVIFVPQKNVIIIIIIIIIISSYVSRICWV